MFKLIIFDLDGPILDSLKRSEWLVRQGIKKLIKENGVPPQKIILSDETFVKYWGYPGPKTAELMFPLLDVGELEVILSCWKVGELKRKIPLVKGALKTLKYLKKKGYFTALLTSRCHHLKFHLGNYNLENLFEIVQSWTPPSPNANPQTGFEKIHKNHIFYAHHKPNPAVLNPILKWAAKRGVSKKEMIMIDDTLVGLETARNARVAFVGVCTGPLSSQEKWLNYGNLEGKYVIKSVAELPEWLEKYGRT